MSCTLDHSHRGAPSSWITRWAHLLQSGGSVLDVACGSGRHASYFADRGHAVTALDRNLDAAQDLAGKMHLVEADIESEPWPLLFEDHPLQFQAVIVTNYLWRPLFPVLLTSLAPGGVLLYETFTSGNETVGRPARADFLLQPMELIEACKGMDIVGYESGFIDAPPRFVQRIAAVKPAVNAVPADQGAIQPARYPL
jgi:SAM-dependent methyltransferase